MSRQFVSWGTPSMKIRTILATAAFAVLANMGVAHASLLGDTVEVQYLYPDQGSVYFDSGTQVVGPSGALYTNLAGGGYFTLNVGPSNINAFAFQFSSYWTPTSFNGFSVTDLSNPLPNFTVDGATNMAGLTNANLSVSGNTLFVNWQGLPFDSGTNVQLDVSAVPLPAALPLFGIAVAGIAAWGRKRHAKSAA